MFQLKKVIDVLVEKGNWLIISNSNINNKLPKTENQNFQMFRVLYNGIDVQLRAYEF